MFWAYSWSVSRDGGRDCYNLFLTSISSVIAIVIGVIEVLGCVQHELQLKVSFLLLSTWSLLLWITCLLLLPVGAVLGGSRGCER